MSIKSDTYRYLLHISDIHIRLHERHDEYRSVFSNLYQGLRNFTNAIIVLTGDLFHNKDKLTPDSILLAQEFLSTLSKIHPVVLIAGNHDCVLHSDAKIDTISALLKYMDCEDIHYFPYTTTYTMKNIMFCVNSRLDNKFLAHDKIDSMGCKKVALYHGIVGSVNQGKVVLSGVNPSKFDGCDAVLLGDIHQHMFINDKKTMGYASSLISQNHGESHEHGFLIWDVYDDIISGRFRCVMNDYAFVTIEIHDHKKIPLKNPNHFCLFVDEEIPKLNLPKYAKIRVVIHTDHNTIPLMTKLRSSHPECTFITTMNLRRQTVPSAENTWLLNVKNFDMESLCSKYIQLNNLSDSILYDPQFQSIVKSLKLKQLETNIEKSWDICSLKFENLMTYNSMQCMTFDDQKNVVFGLIAPNSSGKSSIIDIISYMLYGKFARDASTDASRHILHNGSNEGYGEIILKCATELYCIIKNFKKKKDNTTKVTLGFYQLYSDEQSKSSITIDFQGRLLNGVNIGAENKTRTDQKIVQLVGTHMNFLATSTHLPNPNSPMFLDMPSTKRKAYILELLDMNISDELHTKNHNELLFLKKQTASLSAEIEQIPIDDVLSEIAKLESDKFKFEQKQIDMMLKIDECQQRQAVSIKNHTVCVENSQIQSLFSDCHSEKVELQQQIDQLLNTQNEIWHQISECKVIIGRTDDITNKKLVLENKIERKLHKYKKSLDHLVNTLPSCFEITEFEKQIQNEFAVNMVRISDIEEELAKLKQQHTKVNLEQLYETKGQKLSELGILSERLKQVPRCLNVRCEQIPELIQQRLNFISQSNEIERRIQEQEQNKTTSGDILQKHISIGVDIQTKISFELNVISSTSGTLRELAHLVFNSECECCMKNPTYLLSKDMQSKIDTATINKNDFDQLLVKNQNKIENQTVHDAQIKENLSCLLNKKLIIHTAITNLNSDIQSSENEQIIKHIENEKLKLKFEIDEINEKCSCNSSMQKKIQMMEDTVQKYQIFLRICDYETNNKQRMGQLTEIQILTEKIRQLETYRHKEFEDLSTTQSKYTSLQAQLDIITTSLDNLHTSRRHLESKLGTLDHRVDQVHDISDSAKGVDDSTAQLQVLHTEHTSLVTQLSNTEQKLAKFIVIKNQHDQLTFKYNTEVSKKIKAEEFDKILGKNGICLYLLQQVLPMIEEQTNKLICKYTQKSISMCISNDSILVDLVDKKTTSGVSVFGGMETFLIELSIKLSLSNIIKVPRSSFIFIDEAFSVFDQHNIGKIEEIIDMIKEHFTTGLLVTHDSRICDLLSNHIYIENGDLIIS